MRAARVLLSAVKRTTGLAGLDVDPNGRANYLAVLERIRRDARRLPETSAYRTSLEKMAASRIAIVEATESVSEIEDKIGAGQIEELIVQGKKELDLAASMHTYEPWKSLEVTPPADQWQYPGRK